MGAALQHERESGGDVGLALPLLCPREFEMSRLLAAIAIAASFAFVGTAQAQTYPSRPVTIVVPFPAGGPTDALARVLAERGFSEPDDISIQAAVTANDTFIRELEAITERAQGLTIESEGACRQRDWARPTIRCR